MFALAFAPDGRTLTAIVSHSLPPPAAGSPTQTQASEPIRDYLFVWNVTSPHPVYPVAVFSRNVATAQGNSSLPLLAPSGHTWAAGAPFGGFGVQLWTLN